MSTSATGSSDAGYNPILFFPTRSCVRFLLDSLVYMTFMFRTHKHVFDVTNIIIMLIFWIKLLLNLSNILTCSPPLSPPKLRCHLRLAGSSLLVNACCLRVGREKDGAAPPYSIRHHVSTSPSPFRHRAAAFNRAPRRRRFGRETCVRE